MTRGSAPRQQVAAPREEGVGSPPAAAPGPHTLAHLDVELRRRLADEGVVVRGYDVARVVAVASNRTVRWPVA